MTVKINIEDLLKAGVHYGHQTRYWQPKMKPYIYKVENGMHIVDLQKTMYLLSNAIKFVEKIASEGGTILFVGTKRNARDIIEEEAKRAGVHYISNRWLGGLLTNYKTIKKSINRLLHIEKYLEDGSGDHLPKKEIIFLEREKNKLKLYLDGIKNMPKIPDLIFVVDANYEHTAIKESLKLSIPIVAITDTNTDPSGIDYVIPGNDDSIESISVFVNAVAESCLSGRSNIVQKHKDLKKEDTKETKDRDFYDEHGHKVKVETKL